MMICEADFRDLFPTLAPRARRAARAEDGKGATAAIADMPTPPAKAALAMSMLPAMAGLNAAAALFASWSDAMEA